MGSKTRIEWTDATWNPWVGCRKKVKGGRLREGCRNCYMFRGMRRFGRNPGRVVRTRPRTFGGPLSWSPRKVFVCSWSDFFIEEADEWRNEAWDVMRQAPLHTYQITTKRIERVADHLPPDWGSGWPNVWLGVSVEDEASTWQLDVLAGIPAAVRWISAEPLLEAVDLSPWLRGGGFHWVVTGGESGPRDVIRRADVRWFIDIRDMCLRAGVPFFHKQNGGAARCVCHGAWGCRLVEGETWDQFPILSNR